MVERKTARRVRAESATRLRKKRDPKQREPLTWERIVLAAIDLIDSEGFAAFSMRKLGRSLGVEAMSLYEYFKSKDELLLAIRAHFYSQLEPEVPPGTPWHEELRAVLMTSYRIGVEHPSWAAVHLQVPSVPESRRRGSRDRQLLREAGFTREEAAGAMIALVTYLTGFQYRMARSAPSANPLAQTTRDDAFEMGLDAILAGLRARVDARQE